MNILIRILILAGLLATTTLSFSHTAIVVGRMCQWSVAYHRNSNPPNALQVALQHCRKLHCRRPYTTQYLSGGGFGAIASGTRLTHRDTNQLYGRHCIVGFAINQWSKAGAIQRALKRCRQQGANSCMIVKTWYFK